MAQVGDPPVGRRFGFNDEIHATTIWAVNFTPAENHLTTLPINTRLSGRESERDQDRIEDLGNQVRTTMSRPRWNAGPSHDLVDAIRGRVLQVQHDLLRNVARPGRGTPCLSLWA